ncbi:MAG: DNA-binding protein [Bacteroidetes bacterium QH_2_64_26]|nr:MAG: DNA-binding protein [Bacteroidetes bacterium QH_2_64_26]
MSTPTPYQESSSPALPAPIPTRPVAGRPVDTEPPVFSWTPIPGATRYRVQVASTEAFESILYDDVRERGAALSLGTVLPDGATMIYWRVRTETAEERSVWSEPAHFAVPASEQEAEDAALRVDAAPVPLQPKGMEDPPVDQSAVPFSWEAIPEASGYQLQVAPTENIADPHVDFAVDRTTSVTLYDVLPVEAATYYWRIRPLFRVADPGPWSSPVPFAVAPPATEEDDLAPEAADPQASARAAGPALEARTSRTLSLTVSLIAILSFLATIALIILAG